MTSQTTGAEEVFFKGVLFLVGICAGIALCASVGLATASAINVAALPLWMVLVLGWEIAHGR